MAEFVMKALLEAKGLEDRFHVESAAVSDEECGNPIYPPARRCLTQHGVWFDPAKTARTVTKADYGRFDSIICMDSSNVRRLRSIVGGDPDKKISLLMTYTGTSRDVADPWYTGDFEQTFQDVLAGCEAYLLQTSGCF